MYFEEKNVTVLKEYIIYLLIDSGHRVSNHLLKLYFGHKQMNDKKVSQFCISHEIFIVSS